MIRNFFLSNCASYVGVVATAIVITLITMAVNETTIHNEIYNLGVVDDVIAFGIKIKKELNLAAIIMRKKPNYKSVGNIKYLIIS